MEDGKINGFLIDLDGVLYTGDTPVQGARETLAFLTDNGYPFRCLSNSTRKCRATIAARLDKMGFEIPERSIFTPPLAAVRFIKDSGKSRAFLLVTGDVGRDFAGACADDGSVTMDYVIVGDAGDRVTYATLNHAFRCLMEGAHLIALEKDRYWMDRDGLALSAGPVVAALEMAADTTATVVGKPSKEFFGLALQDLGMQKEEVVMIGDDIYTDVDGAQAAGIRGVLVRTGKFRPDVCEKSAIHPAAIIDSVRDIGTLLPITRS
ncbi:TIGR01458 family HAD-type hydrolase [Methanoregula sp.]|uniref:TIGR01458 family HAD-type hydrolase n=1 Tax=Methanoregula sp. TaxID=2052170 RepID=UPI002C9ECC51|nr:TIGR01458 family HAD-type hydrolase [Methanoregula sp.]HVP96576.1 TIGR01458 family HAD-type hydrolase [Methanoregula sp.]